MPDIYLATSYRQFLTDWLEEKAGRPSQNGLARKIGCAPSMLSLIRKQERNLQDPILTRLVAALHLSTAEADVFRLLVVQDDATRADERRDARTSIDAIRRYRTATLIDDQCSAILQDEMCPVILEMARSCGFRAEPDWIARRLLPARSVDAVRTVLHTLQARGLLVEREPGNWSVTYPDLVTPHQPNACHTGIGWTEYHYRALDAARGALKDVPASLRQYGVSTLSLPASAVPEAMQRMTSFHEQLMALSRRTEEQHVILQVSTQLFPLTVAFGLSGNND